MQNNIRNINLLSPDPSEGVLDPLSTPLDEASVTLPLIPDGKVLTFEIRRAIKAPVKSGDAVPLNAGETNMSCAFQCVTVEDVVATNKETLRAGFMIFHRLPCTITDKKGPAEIKPDWALLAKACKISGGTIADLINNPAQFENRRFSAKVTIKKANGDFPESNALKPIVQG